MTWPRTIICTLAAVLLLTLYFSGNEGLSDPDVSTCRANPEPTCLADLGVEIALAEPRPPPTSARATDYLAIMGRFDDALALEMHFRTRNGHPAEEAAAKAARRLASHRLAAALGDGMSLDAALADIPAADGGSIWIAALKLLGRSPYGNNNDLLPPTMDDRERRALIGEMADRIETLAAGGSARRRASLLHHAAELRGAIGDGDGARHALAQIPVSEMQTSLSVDLLRTVGPETVLPDPAHVDAVHPLLWLNAARADDHPERARRYLDAAFLTFADPERLWPDFSGLERLVRAAIEVGGPSLGLDFARTVAELARNARHPFAPFANIDAAEALLASGAPPDEVRASLDVAQAMFPADPHKAIAPSIVTGVIRWRNSGLEREARYMVAALRARIGDVEAVRPLMAGIGQPEHAWLAVLDRRIAVEHNERLLAWAAEDTPPHDMAYLKAMLAQEIFLHEGSDRHRAWAKDTLERLVDGAVPDTRPFHTQKVIVYAARAAQEPALVQGATAGLVELAFKHGDGIGLIDAGLQISITRATQ